MSQSNAENIKLGTCRVLFDGKDLGYTIGGVEVTVTTDTHATMVDQEGDTTIKEFVKGRNITVSTNLAETTLENLVAVMPGATLIEGVGDKKHVEVKTGVGMDLVKMAKSLTLHPIQLPAEDKSEDLTIFRAATAGSLDYAFKKDDERVFAVEFKGYPDANSRLFAVGDVGA